MTFSLVRDAIATVMPVEKLRHLAFSHFESDECGALNQFLAVAPNAAPVCSRVAAMTSVGDFSDRPPLALAYGKPAISSSRPPPRSSAAICSLREEPPLRPSRLDAGRATSSREVGVDESTSPGSHAWQRLVRIRRRRSGHAAGSGGTQGGAEWLSADPYGSTGPIVSSSHSMIVETLTGGVGAWPPSYTSSRFGPGSRWNIGSASVLRGESSS